MKETFTAPSDASSFIHHPNLLVSPFPPVRMTSSRFKGTHWNCCATVNLPSRCGSVQIHVPGRQVDIPKIDPIQWNPSSSTMDFQFMDNNNSPKKDRKHAAVDKLSDNNLLIYSSHKYIG